MKNQTISFRCPDDIIKEMEILCEHNSVNRSGFIVQALKSLLSGLAEQGVYNTQQPLPPSPVEVVEK